MVAGVNVMKGTPRNRTSIGAALVDTTDQLASAVSVAIVGSILATRFPDELANGRWTTVQRVRFHEAVSLGTGILALLAALLIGWAFVRTRRPGGQEP